MMATGAFIWRREDVKTDFLGSAPFTFRCGSYTRSLRVVAKHVRCSLQLGFTGLLPTWQLAVVENIFGDLLCAVQEIGDVVPGIPHA